MKSKKVALVFAPPNRRRVLQKFFKTNSLKTFDVDSSLCEELQVKDLREAISLFPRNKLEEVWEEVIDTILSSIRIDSDVDSAILVCHAIYHNDSTRELFPIFDTTFFNCRCQEKGINVSHTVLIIDDIIEIFKDLTEPASLFGNTSFRDFMNDYPFLKNEKSAKPYIDWVNYCLNYVLNWRSQEVTLVQNFSRQLGSKFMLWGLKQSPNVLLDWLKNPENKLYYLSHPISEPRRFLSSNSEWPKIVGVINDIQTELQKQGMLLVLPTSIDEFRFEKDKDDNFTTKLTPRWPIQPDVKKVLLGHRLINEETDMLEVATPYDVQVINGNVTKVSPSIINAIKDYVNGVFRSLEKNIVEQLANRDHLLVWSTDGVIVVEPFSLKDKTIHRGVQKEIEYLLKINVNSAEPKKLCVVFSRSTLKTVTESQEFATGFKEHLIDIITGEHPEAKRQTLSHYMDDEGNISHPGSALGPMGLSRPLFDTIVPKLELYKERARANQFISQTMLLEEKDLEFTTIVIVNDVKQLTEKDVMWTIQKFFLEGISDDSWRKEVNDG